CSTFNGMTVNLYTVGTLGEISTAGDSTIFFQASGPLITASLSFGGNCVAAFNESGGGWRSTGGPSNSLMVSKNGWMDIDVGVIVKYPIDPPLILNDKTIPGFAGTLEFLMRFNGQQIIASETFEGLQPADVPLTDPGVNSYWLYA